MRLPEKPKDWTKTIKKNADSVFKLMKDDEIRKQIIDFNRRYFYWTELKYRVKDAKKQELYWALMKLLRQEKYEHPKNSPINLIYTILPDIYRKLHEFDKFLAGNIKIQTKNLELENRFIISSLMEEAIASSIIEGAATTRQVAKDMLKKQRKPNTNSEKMIINNYDTMQMIRDKRNEKLTPDLLLEIQKSITQETLEKNDDVGKFRDTNDIVVGHSTYAEIICHRPPDYKKLPNLIKELCDYANDDSGNFIHPIIKGIIIHFLIGYIHPFNDGNGRTARSVFYWYVLSRDYWLFEYMSVSRIILRSRKKYDLSYIYTENDEMDLTYFINYNIQCINQSLNDMKEYIQRKQKEQRESRKILHTLKNLNYRQAAILDEMMKNLGKFYTIKEISETYNVVYQTARTDLLYLKRKKYIDMRKISKAFEFIFTEENRMTLNTILKEN